MRARSAEEATTLSHPLSTLIMGLSCFGFFAAIAVISNVVPNKTTTWWTTAIFVGFAALSTPMILDYFMANHRVSSEGLSCRKMIGTTHYLRWEELQRVHYSPVMKWFVLKGSNGSVARISVMLVGLPEFARLLLEHAPVDAIEPAALPVLQATANGNPPSVWG